MAKKFVFGETKVAETSEEIRENKADHKVDNTLASTPTVSDDSHVPSPVNIDETLAVDIASVETSGTTDETRGKATVAHTPFVAKGKKSENGIVVNVPMDDYMQLMMMKIQTGRTLKDLALQAIHEFVDRNKM